VVEGFFRRMLFSTERFIKARQLVASMDSSLRTLDALHRAATITESVMLLTADRDLARVAKRFKCGVILVK